MAKVYIEDVQVGMSLPQLTKGPLRKIQLVRYAGASRDFNPIHVIEEPARQAGLGGVIAHGMLTMAFVGQMLTDWAGVDRLRRFGVRFSAMVRPADVITCKGAVIDKCAQDGDQLITCEVWAENTRGEKVVQGNAVLSLPTKNLSGAHHHKINAGD